MQRELGYRFRNPDLLDEALSHRSFIGVHGEDRLESNERLEFLGDAVLDLVVAHELFGRYPQKAEGELTELKSLLVSRPTLHQTAGELGIGAALFLSENEEATGGRNRPSILADALEAVLGAVYLDGGYEAVRKIVLDRLVRELPAVAGTTDYRNYKSILLEHVQRQKLGRLIYRTKREEGPDHEKKFTVEVLLERRVLGEGTGYSKKQAQQEAAKAALTGLGIEINNNMSDVETGK